VWEEDEGGVALSPSCVVFYDEDNQVTACETRRKAIAQRGLPPSLMSAIILETF